MGFTSDNIPQKSPLSREYRDFVAGIAKDVVSLMRYKPILDSMYMDVSGGGSAQSPVFPAKITEGTGPYFFVEVKEPNSTEELEGGITGTAFNTMEVGLTNDFFPPGLTRACIENSTPAGAPISIFVQSISPGVVVMMSKHEASGEYYFCVPNSICAACETGGLASEQTQQQERIEQHESRTMNMLSKVIPRRFRNRSSSGGY